MGVCRGNEKKAQRLKTIQEEVKVKKSISVSKHSFQENKENLKRKWL